MRVGLISDIHGNLLALEKVLADLERDPPDEILCLGDVAATGPRPRETVERLREAGFPVVMGNADAELLRPIPEKQGSDDNMRRIADIDRWCAEQLSSADLDYLREFRPTLETSLDHGRTLLCFHGSPRSFDDAIVATTLEGELGRMFSGHGATVMAGGHTHAQLVRQYRGTNVLNPGSLGLNPSGAEYAMIESTDDRLRIELRHLPLPGEAVAREALDSGMPHAEWWASFWNVP